MVPACSPLLPLILAASMVQVTPSHSATVEPVPVFSIVTRLIVSIESLSAVTSPSPSDLFLES